MKSLDWLIVTRRFWPHSSLTELAFCDLANNLIDAGHNVTVATLKCEKNWSENIQFGKFPIVRFARPVSGPWTSFRFGRSLSRHFSTTNYDGVIVSGLGDEASAILKITDQYTRTILQVDDSFVGVSGRLHQKHVEMCHAADGVVATSQTVQRQLESVGGMPSTCLVHPGLRNACGKWSCKSEIRVALSKAHPVIRIEESLPLLVTHSQMKHGHGLETLIEAWPQVLKKFPGAKLWILGDGPGINSIWQMVVERELAYSIILPGFFDDLYEVFRAADLYVHTEGSMFSGEGLIRAMTSGLASIALKNDVTEDLIESEGNGWLVAPNATELGNSIVHLLGNSDLRKQIGHVAPNQLVDRFNPVTQVNKYVDLICSYSDQLAEVSK